LCEKEVFDAKTQEIDAVRKSLIQNNNNNSAYVQQAKQYCDSLNKLVSDIAEA